jgi:hypothetical protein
VVLGDAYAWIGLRRSGSRLVLTHRTAAEDESEVDAAAPITLARGRTSVRLRVEVGPGGVCRFAADPDGRGLRPVGGAFTATPSTWVGATLGLFGTAPSGPDQGDTAGVDWFRVGPA